MKINILIFAAHPDDAELSMGGTIAKFIESGISVGIIDLTRGELGSRGDAETRKDEAQEASRILNITVRENLLIPDGDIQLYDENIKKIVVPIRKYRPQIIFAPYVEDRHPDHVNTSKLVKRAMFVSGLSKVATFENNVPQQSYRPQRLYYYMQTYTFKPSFIIDISDYFDKKMQSIRAFKTQFHDPTSQEPETFISSPEFIDYIEARSKFYGFQIRKRYGEPFFSEEEIEVSISDLLNL